MKFSAAAALASLAAAVSAAPAFTNTKFELTPGSSFTLTWTNASGPVTIVLATGPSTNLVKVATIDSEDTKSSFTWTVPTTLVSGTYAFEISDSTGTNYSKQFALTGTGSASASASTASSTAAVSSTSEESSLSTTSSSTTSSSSHSTTALTTTKSNSTTTATKSSSTTSKATSTATTVPANTNNGPQAKSPLAFVLVSVAALLYFN